MTQCQVTVAAYSSFTVALAAWDAMDETASGFVDAALVEGDATTIRAFHRHARSTYAKGGVAAAVVGVLRPECIVTGAVAGGVGGQVLALVGRAISRQDLARLGEVLDSAPIAFVTLLIAAPRASASAPNGADAWVTVGSTIILEELQHAFDRDEPG